MSFTPFNKTALIFIFLKFNFGFNNNFDETLSSIFILLIFFSGCALVTDEYQANQRKVIAYLLEDLPLPDDAEIVKAPTVLLGTGEAISGRIILTSGFSPAENLIFYGTETLTTGWQLISSKVGVNPVPIAQTGSYAIIVLSAFEDIGILSSSCLDKTSFVLPFSFSSNVSPIHTIGTILYSITLVDFKQTSLLVSLNNCLLSEWPRIQNSIFKSKNALHEISPVKAPS